MTQKKILFITLSNIGDAVMTLPTLEYLHYKYPNSSFDLVCDKRSSEIFYFIPYVNRIFIKDKDRGFTGNILLIKELRKKKYDIAVDLRTDIYLFFIRSKEKFYKIKNDNIHSVEKHFLSIEKDLDKIPKLKFYIPEKVRKKINKYFIHPNKQTISIALGANSIFKIWPTESFITLASLISNSIHQVILVGDKKDFDKAEVFKKNSKIKSINLCGKLKLIETAAIIEKTNFFIGNDSGLGHIASAVGTRSFTVFGKGDPQRYRPWGGRSFWYQNKEKDITFIDAHEIYEKIKFFFH